MKFNTKTIHGGQSPDKAYGSVMPPIYQTSTYAQTTPGGHKGYEYSRTHNPTRDALEKSFASIENGHYGLAFGSGLAAIDAVIKLLKPGDEVISTNDLYGGTYRLFTKIFEKFQIKFHFTGMQDIQQIENCISPKTKLIWVETPTNPMLNIIDIKAVSALAKKHSVLLAVDNTFATPYLQRPLDLGADIVVYSGTKHIDGQGRSLGGAILSTKKHYEEYLKPFIRHTGPTLSPFNAWVLLKGLETLQYRMDQHCHNTLKIANYLFQHPKVEKTIYPDLKNHPQYALAKEQMLQGGSIVTFVIKGNNAFKFMNALNIFDISNNLGDTKSLVTHPATTTHRVIGEEARKKLNIPDTMIRLSIGLEDIDDLIEDIENAFKQVK